MHGQTNVGVVYISAHASNVFQLVVETWDESSVELLKALLGPPSGCFTHHWILYYIDFTIVAHLAISNWVYTSLWACPWKDVESLLHLHQPKAKEEMGKSIPKHAWQYDSIFDFTACSVDLVW